MFYPLNRIRLARGNARCYDARLSSGCSWKASGQWTQLNHKLKHHVSSTPRIHIPKHRSGRPAAVRASPALKASPRWPIVAIKAASSSGFLGVRPEASINFLNDAWALVCEGKLNRKSIEAIMQDYGMDIYQLTSIARLLVIQSSDRHTASLGLDLLSTSADLGDEAAALILVDIAFENKASMDIGSVRYQKALSIVKRIAHQDANLEALVLMGKIHEEAKQINDALKCYSTAIDLNKKEQNYESHRFALAQAFRGAGRLSLTISGSEEIALNHFATAAYTYEDEYAFYKLASLKGQNHPDYVRLMSQAAISGVSEAAYRLGLWHSKEGDNLISETDKTASYCWATHWFDLVKTTQGLETGAILHLARIEGVRSWTTKSGPISLTIKDILKDSDINPKDIENLLAGYGESELPATASSIQDALTESGCLDGITSLS